MGDCCSTGKRQNNNDEDATKMIGGFIERAPNKNSELRVIQDDLKPLFELWIIQLDYG